jgi:hypothetical protein
MERRSATSPTSKTSYWNFRDFVRIFLDTTEAIRYVGFLRYNVISGHLDRIDVIYAGESRWPKIL